MARISYKRRRFPPAVIQYAVWLYFRFTLGQRDVEEMMAHRGVDVSYETIRDWTVKFGPVIAANLRRRKLPPSPHWRLDEMISTIRGEHVWIWRAVDEEGGVMDMIVQKRRDTRAAVRFLRRLSTHLGCTRRACRLSVVGVRLGANEMHAVRDCGVRIAV
jgi:transposase-like protein